MDRKRGLYLGTEIEKRNLMFSYPGLKRAVAYSVISLLFFSSIGCVTVGPYVSSEEVRRAREELEVKALKFKIEQLRRVNDIGYRLVAHLPEAERKGYHPYSGLLVARVNKYLRQLYGLPRVTGAVVIGVVKDSPAEAAGILPGDIILRLDGKRIGYARQLMSFLKRCPPGKRVNLEVLRGDQKITLSFKMGQMPLEVYFKMAHEQEVNAGTTPKVVAVTYGLMRFVRSDHEVAVVLAHELAHIIKGHHLKSAGTGLLSMLAGLLIGMGIESVSPGAGADAMRISEAIFHAKFSQDLEREADYFGLYYVHYAGYDVQAGVDVWERFAIEVPQSLTRNFFSTHPSSPERMLRLKKTVEEIKGAGERI